ncbi:MAG: hypothetical protein JF586_22970 [Burkholderiales bacterium]|nr:hypothetical protein [Burkholderiales bacterium]
MDSSFRRSHQRANDARRADMAPSRFPFAAKLPRVITHA